MKLYTLAALLIISQWLSAQKTVHVHVALCDNLYQGIVPVPSTIGNGDDPRNNLYWGCGYGVKTYFKRHGDWELLEIRPVDKDSVILEWCIFQHKTKNVYLVTDAYRGREIKQAINDLVYAGAGYKRDTVRVGDKCLEIGSGASLLAYIGHDGLMEFDLNDIPKSKDNMEREAIILACISKEYFNKYVVAAKIYPLVWTTGLMAPEAYTLSFALDAWIKGESRETIRNEAANGYNTYQKCGINGARRLLVGGF
jgi:hypothetical protein